MAKRFSDLEPGDVLAEMHDSDWDSRLRIADPHQVVGHIKTACASGAGALILHAVRERWGRKDFAYLNKTLVVTDWRPVGTAVRLVAAYCYDDLVFGLVDIEVTPEGPRP